MAALWGHETVNFTTVQPDAPTLDQPVIKDAKALIFDKQVVVEWDIPTTASPQLGYKLEVFDRKGKLLKTFDDVAPHVTAKRLDLDDAAKTVKLTVIDIFDQETSVTLTAKRTRTASAKRISKLRSGLKSLIPKAVPDRMSILKDAAVQRKIGHSKSYVSFHTADKLDEDKPEIKSAE